MRYHDIERLKQAASRYKADATCLGDIEELVDYAIDKLDEPSGAGKVNNGDEHPTIPAVGYDASSESDGQMGDRQ